MSLLPGKTNRRILPRWRTSSKASQAADFVSLKAPKRVTSNIDQQLQQVTDDFTKSPSIGIAAELLSASLFANKTETANSAATFLLEHENDAPETLIHLAKSIVEGDVPFKQLGDSKEEEQVTQIRKLLRINPDNPMLWSDMARHHASLGHKKQAFRCMTTALQLAPNHRWMLRTASRFFVHHEDSIYAHKLLANHPRTRNDPWLIAAELACAQVAGRAPKYWRQATDFLKWEKVSPLHISELATAIAMMELEAGERKKARKYIQKGLITPTENTLAQVYWAKENKHLNDGYGLDDLIESAEDAHEANYRSKLVQGDLLVALNEAEIWKADEPFATRPCSEIAFVASLLDDHNLTIKMANHAKMIDGQIDPNFEMNNIFSILSSGKLNIKNDAEEIEKLRLRLTRVIKQGDDNSYHALANLGLWHYRYGDISIGRELYQQAIAIAQKLHITGAIALAATFAARESILAREASAESDLLLAKEFAKKYKSTASEFYVRKLDDLIKKPFDAQNILSPNSAQKYIKLEEHPPLYRIEKTAKGDVLWIPKQSKLIY